MTHCPHYRLIAQQSRDIQDLLNLIKELEERIIKLETAMFRVASVGVEDNWYWDH